jgi:hypothetical protein
MHQIRPRPELFCDAGYHSLGESLPIGRSSKATAREIRSSQKIGLIFRPEGRFSRLVRATEFNSFSAHIFPVLASCQARREDKMGGRSWRSALDPSCCRPRRRSKGNLRVRGNSAEGVLLWPRTNSSYPNEPIIFGGLFVRTFELKICDLRPRNVVPHVL